MSLPMSMEGGYPIAPDGRPQCAYIRPETYVVTMGEWRKVCAEIRAYLASADERAMLLRCTLSTEPWPVQHDALHALEIIARARAAELRDPEPSPNTIG